MKYKIRQIAVKLEISCFSFFFYFFVLVLFVCLHTKAYDLPIPTQSRKKFNNFWDGRFHHVRLDCLSHDELLFPGLKLRESSLCQ